MLSGIAIIATGPRYMPYAWVFVVVVVVLILLIFTRMYGRRDPSRRRPAHRAGRGIAHQVGRVQKRGGNHRHRAVSKRRPNRT